MVSSGIEDKEKITDLGSGNGFPAIPIKILLPDTIVDMVEVNQRKAAFLKEAVRVLEIQNINVLCERVEDYEFSFTEKITARAFKPIEEIKKILLPSRFCGEIIVWEKRSGARVAKYPFCNVEKM